MQQADFKRFKIVMNGMAKVYEREIDAAVLDAYWLALGRWSLEEFESAAAQLLRTSKFMPRPADFHELARAGRPTAGEAWAHVLQLARHGGMPVFGQESPPSLSPLARRALDAIGGLNAVAMSDVDKTPFLERRFCEHYESISDAEEVREALPELTSTRRSIGGPLGMPELLKLKGNGRPS